MHRITRLRRLALTVVAAALLVGATGCGGAATTAEESASPSAAVPPAVLTAATGAAQQALDALDAALAAAAQDLGQSGLTGDAAAAILKGVVADHPEVFDVWTQDATGTILVIEPTAYTSFVGKQGTPEESAALLIETVQPQLSPTITAEEGFFAAVLAHPVVDEDGVAIGAVAALLHTDAFLGAVVTPLAQAENLDTIWAMDTEGNNIFDPDKQDLGHNILTGEYYAPFPSLVALAAEMAVTPAGAGSYEFPPSETNAETITKRAHWDSVGLHGTEWRLVAAFAEPAAQQ